jgi:hypothetical protein
MLLAAACGSLGMFRPKRGKQEAKEKYRDRESYAVKVKVKM